MLPCKCFKLFWDELLEQLKEPLDWSSERFRRSIKAFCVFDRSSHERTTRCGSLMGKGSDGGYALRSGATRYGRWHRRRAAGLRHERSSHDAASRGPGSRRPSRVPHRARPRAARPRGNGQCAAARCSAHVNLLNHSGNSNPSIWSYIKR